MHDLLHPAGEIRQIKCVSRSEKEFYNDLYYFQWPNSLGQAFL